MWVILRRFVADALELVTTNAHDWRPDFILKLRITFHPPLAPALRYSCWRFSIGTGRISSKLHEAGFGARQWSMNSPIQLVSKQNYLCRIGCQVNFETLLSSSERQ